MKLKLDENGHVVVQDGRPVYVYDDGKEVAFDAPSTVAKISALNAEAKSHRERAEANEKLAKAFEGLDADEARKALGIVKNLDDKKLVDAGEVEKMKAEHAKAWQAQIDEANKKAETLAQQLDNELIGGAFARSKFIAENFAAQGPAGIEIAQALFRSRFKVEDGKLVAADGNGGKLYSRTRPGELADFDEAMDAIVGQYAHRDQILKGTGSSGAGATDGAKGNGGKKTLDRKSFEALDPQARMAHMQGGGVITD